jgi:hypothetical protein
MSVTEIGPHRLRHGNLLDGAEAFLELMHNDSADITYCDPPWGYGNLRYWQTINRNMTGEEARITPNLESFLHAMFALITAYAKGPILIEYGVRWREELTGVAREHDLVHHGFGVPVYGRPPRPLHLHLFTPRRLNWYGDVSERWWAVDVNGTTGLATVLAAATPFAVPGGIVFDPCCGLGYSARMAVKYGMRFRGNELNAERLGRTGGFLMRDALKR